MRTTTPEKNETRVCNKCDTERPLTDFHKRSSVGTTRRPTCKFCASNKRRVRSKTETEETWKQLELWPAEISPPNTFGTEDRLPICEACGDELMDLCRCRVNRGLWVACEIPDKGDIVRMEAENES